MAKSFEGTEMLNPDVSKKILEKYSGFEFISFDQMPARQLTDEEYTAVYQKYKKKSAVFARTLIENLLIIVISLIFIVVGIMMIATNDGERRLKLLGIAFVGFPIFLFLLIIIPSYLDILSTIITKDTKVAACKAGVVFFRPKSGEVGYSYKIDLVFYEEQKVVRGVNLPFELKRILKENQDLFIMNSHIFAYDNKGRLRTY